MTREEYYENLEQAKELYHYGVPGMKWGVRKYQNTDGSLTDKGQKKYNKYSAKADKYAKKADKARTALGRDYNIARKHEAQYSANYVKDHDRNYGKGRKMRLGDKMRDNFKEDAKQWDSLSKANKEMASKAKTKLGRAIDNQYAANAKNNADYSRANSRRTFGERYVHSVLIGGMDRKHTRLSGRTTTRGAEFLNYTLTLGVAGLIGDAKYMHDKKKKSSK